MSPSARKNLIRGGFIAELKFAGINPDDIITKPENEEIFKNMKNALGKTFKSYGLTNEIEF